MSHCVSSRVKSERVTPKSAVQTTLIGFYIDEDVCNAKELLISFAEKWSQKIDDLPRNKQSRIGESKRRLDVEDVLSHYDFLDKMKISLPTFVAANSNRLSRVLPDEMDLYQLVESVSAIRSELNVVKAELDAIPSGTFSSVMDSLTEITCELKDVWGS